MFTIKRFVLNRPGDVLDSVYDLELSERAWISQITRGIGQFIDGGNGTLGCVFRMGERVEMPVLSPIRADDEVPDFFRYLHATEQASGGRGLDAERFGSLFAASGMGTLSVNRTNLAAYDVFRREFEPNGVLDAAGLIVPHPESRSFVFVTSRQKELSEVPQRARARWIDLQNHIAAVYDLRYRLRGDTFEETDAVWFDTAGECVEAGPARDAAVRERLRAAVRLRENSRGGASSSQRGDLEKYWSNVINGKWAILDRFDTDGRRYVIALPISKYGDSLRGLSSRERQVLHLLSDGLANKAIGFELGISETSVSSHLNNIYRKLGIDDRSALVQIVGALRAQGKFAV